MLNEKRTIALTYKGYQIIVTQEKDGSAQYVVFDHKKFDKEEEKIVQHIISVGNYKSSTVNIIDKDELKNLINHIIKIRGK